MNDPVLSLLKELVGRPSVTPDDAGCQDLIASRLSEKGFTIRKLDCGPVKNLWATHGEGAPFVCLAGHTDVVPPGPVSQWSSPPFEPEVRDGYLYGRGASDMKAGVAAMVVALERLAEAPHDGTVGLLLTSDEEGPGVDGTAHALGVLTSENVVIDAAIVGEPTSEQVFGDVVKNGRRGSMTGTIMVQGIQGHTAYPQLAKNAVHFAAPAITELAHLTWDNPIPAFPATTLQISGMKAGTGASNVIPGQCEVQFNIRFGMGQTVTEIQDQVAGVFASHGISDRIEWEVSALPFLTLPGPLVDAVARSIQAVTGVTPRGSTGGGTSDARFFATHDIPVIEFGPLNATIHAVNERVAISCLEPLAEIYRLTLVSLLT